MHTQLSLFPTPLFPTPYHPVAAPQHDPYWDEIVKQKVAADTSNAQNPDNCVREQVAADTLKVAPEHIHWLEQYWVERCCKKYYYWRYCWMEGRKIRRCHIGAVRSLKANLKKQAVEDAIRDEESPHQIKQLIRGSGVRLVPLYPVKKKRSRCVVRSPRELNREDLSRVFNITYPTESASLADKVPQLHPKLRQIVSEVQPPGLTVRQTPRLGAFHKNLRYLKTACSSAVADQKRHFFNPRTS